TTVEGELPAQGQLELSLLINTGFEEGTWSQSWVLSITNRIGEVSILNQSSTSFTIISQQQQQQEEKNTQTTTEGTSPSTIGMTGIIIAILVVFSIIGTIGYLKLRKPDEVKDDTKSFDSAYDYVQQPIEREIVDQPIEQEIVHEQPIEVQQSQPFTPAIDDTKSFDSAFDHVQQPIEREIVDQPIEQEIVHEQPIAVQQSQPFTPAIYATPTSTDEHGYEWFTEENGTNWYRLQGSGSQWYLHQP
ncbi:MAG: hypothetical protein CXT67_02160, partial [Methanobacteriota archaeon]